MMASVKRTNISSTEYGAALSHIAQAAASSQREVLHIIILPAVCVLNINILTVTEKAESQVI